MNNLVNKTIGGKSVTLKKVPASSARKIQTLLLASAATPLAEALSQELPENGGKKQTSVKSIVNGISGVLANLKDGELDELIGLCSPYILIDGELFNEDMHFDAGNLFDMYETLWFFLKETFENFIKDALSRFKNMEGLTAQ